MGAAMVSVQVLQAHWLKTIPRQAHMPSLGVLLLVASFVLFALSALFVAFPYLVCRETDKMRIWPMVNHVNCTASIALLWLALRTEEREPRTVLPQVSAEQWRLFRSRWSLKGATGHTSRLPLRFSTGWIKRWRVVPTTASPGIKSMQ